MSLPDIVIDNIFEHVNPKTKKQMSQTCKRLYLKQFELQETRNKMKIVASKRLRKISSRVDTVKLCLYSVTALINIGFIIVIFTMIDRLQASHWIIIGVIPSLVDAVLTFTAYRLGSDTRKLSEEYKAGTEVESGNRDNPIKILVTLWMKRGWLFRKITK